MRRLQILLIAFVLPSCQGRSGGPALHVERASVECVDSTGCAEVHDLDELLGADEPSLCFNDGTFLGPDCHSGVVSMNHLSDLPNCAIETIACPPETVCDADSGLPERYEQSSFSGDCALGHGPSCVKMLCLGSADIVNCRAPELDYDPAVLDAATLAALGGEGPDAPQDCVSPNALQRPGVRWCRAYQECQTLRLTTPVSPGWHRALSGTPGDVTAEDWLFFSTPEGCRVDVIIDKSQASTPAPLSTYTCADSPCLGFLHVGCTAL